MKPNKYLEKNFKIILSSSFKEKDNFNFGNKWKNETMKKIRYLGPISPNLQFLFIFNKLFFRFSFTVFFVLFIGSIYVNITHQYEMHNIFYEGPFDDFLNIYTSLYA